MNDIPNYCPMKDARYVGHTPDTCLHCLKADRDMWRREAETANAHARSTRDWSLHVKGSCLVLSCPFCPQETGNAGSAASDIERARAFLAWVYDEDFKPDHVEVQRLAELFVIIRDETVGVHDIASLDGYGLEGWEAYAVTTYEAKHGVKPLQEAGHGCVEREQGMSVHDWKLLTYRGEDAPGRSLDSYSQCSQCGALKHDYAHNGGQTSPNYPLLYKFGVAIPRDSECLGLLGAARSGIPAAPNDHDRATAFALEWLPELNDAFASSNKFRARLVEEFAHVRAEERDACAKVVEKQASINRMRMQALADDSDRMDGGAQTDDIDRAEEAAEVLEYTAMRVRASGASGTREGCPS